jgi:solute carrier family 25 S-adenosylmethionine transporter 26
MAEVVACTIRVPIEVMKQKMQVKQHRSMAAAARAIYHTEGLLAFYRGLGPTIFREVFNL